jgi:putative thioredoxin
MDYIIGQKPKAAAPRPAPAAAPAAGGSIIDGDQRNFMADVIEASREIPVLVDFWATWCGPCKTLTPILERVVTAAGGRLKLVKIDIDRNAALVQQLAQLGLPMKSVPTVAAFWQGQIADIFQGALPESDVKRFAEALLKLAGGSMPAADLLEEARAAMEAGQPLDAAELFSALIQGDPENPDGWGGLIRALIAAGDEAQAEDALAQIPPAIATHAQITGARAALALAAEGRQAAAQLGGYQQRLAADPNDHQARYDLATALNAQGKREEAAAALLEILKRERGWNDQAARLQLLKFFEAWGFDDPAAMAGRRKLSALLFS